MSLAESAPCPNLGYGCRRLCPDRISTPGVPGPGAWRRECVDRGGAAASCGGAGMANAPALARADCHRRRGDLVVDPAGQRARDAAGRACERLSGAVVVVRANAAAGARALGYPDRAAGPWRRLAA